MRFRNPEGNGFTGKSVQNCFKTTQMYVIYYFLLNKHRRITWLSLEIGIFVYLRRLILTVACMHDAMFVYESSCCDLRLVYWFVVGLGLVYIIVIIGCFVKKHLI